MPMKDPPECPEFWYGGGQNSGEKEVTLLYVLNFGMVGDQILVKKKDPPVCPTILVWSVTKFG